MKKLLAALVVLIAFGICTPSYGVSLIYKLSISVKGVDDVTGLPKSIPLKGYLLLHYTDDGQSLSFADANLIMYGKDVTKNKVYVELDYSGNDLLDKSIWTQGTSYDFLNLWTYYDEPFNFEGLMFGKQKAADIGGGTTLIDCVSSYKGAFWVYSGMLLDHVFDISGTGTISAKLWTAFTKKVNDDTMGLWYTQDRILEEIKLTYLIGYANVTP